MLIFLCKFFILLSNHHVLTLVPRPEHKCYWNAWVLSRYFKKNEVEYMRSWVEDLDWFEDLVDFVSGLLFILNF